MTGRKRMWVAVLAAAIMVSAWSYKSWQRDQAMQTACDNMIRGYHTLLAEGGDAAVDPLRFVIQSRQYREEGGRCDELVQLAASVERGLAKADPASALDLRTGEPHRDNLDRTKLR